MTLESIDAWLADIGDGDIQDWANKGLLRRGGKLAAAAASAAVEPDGDQLTASLDGHRQALRGPGFAGLECSCPAAGTCHHLVALLLLAKARSVPKAQGRPPAQATPPDWLLGDEAPLARALGRTHLERAGRWMRLGLVPDLEEGQAGWVAEVSERDIYRVRISRSAGPAAATCTCDAPRCPHRALVVLELRRRLGLFDPTSIQNALSDEQTDALAAVEHWMLQLLTGGLAGLSAAIIDQGRVLATTTRQADLPRLGSVLGGLLDLLEAERRGRSFADPRSVAGYLAALRLLTTGLQRASPQVRLIRLTGVNRALYRKTQGLRLIGVAAEHWQGQQGQEGISLHFYGPREGRWYRLTQTRRPLQDQQWSPLQTWQEGRWADGPLLRELPGTEVLLQTGWVGADGRLSGRPGTMLTHQALDEPTAALPIETDFTALRHRYAAAMVEDPTALPPRLPVVIRLATAAPPQFDAQTQWWTQQVMDQNGTELTLGVLIRNPIAARKRQRMEILGQGPASGRLLFGALYRAPPTGLTLDPIALLNGGAATWMSTTLH